MKGCTHATYSGEEVSVPFEVLAVSSEEDEAEDNINWTLAISMCSRHGEDKS